MSRQALMTVNQAHKRLTRRGMKLHIKTLYRWIADEANPLPVHRVRGRVYFTRADLDAICEEQGIVECPS